MQKLAESGEATNIARRHVRNVQHSLETTAAGSSGDQASRARERALLLADARLALAWAYANDDGAELRVPLAGACAGLFVELNLLNEVRLWSSRALAVLDDTTRGSAWELELQTALGHAFMFTERNSEQAENALRRGLEIAEALGDLSNKFRLLARLNMFYRRTGEYRRLLPIALEAESTARLIGDEAGIAGAKALLGVSYHLVGNQAAAQLHLDEGVLGDQALRSTQPGHFAYARTPQIPLARVLVAAGLSRPGGRLRPPDDGRGGAAGRRHALHCALLVRVPVRMGRRLGRGRIDDQPPGGSCRHARTGSL